VIKFSFVGSKTSATSRVIEVFSAGPICHVDAIEPGTGLLWGARFDKVGGQPRGFYPRPPSYIVKETCQIVIGVAATKDQEARFWAATRKAEKQKYDWLGILAFGFGANWHRRGERFCSEAQYDHLIDAGVIARRLFEKANKITPMTLLTSLADRPTTKILLRRGC
jgi:hypothetical protein